MGSIFTALGYTAIAAATWTTAQTSERRNQDRSTWRCATCLAELWDINGELRDAPHPDAPILSHLNTDDTTKQGTS